MRCCRRRASPIDCIGDGLVPRLPSSPSALTCAIPLDDLVYAPSALLMLPLSTSSNIELIDSLLPPLLDELQ
jgi:hypothetical protein